MSIEYGLLAALTGASVIGGATYIGGSLDSKFSIIGHLFDDAPQLPRGRPAS